MCSLHLTLGARDSKLIDGQAPCPHHHQSKSFHDPDLFVKSRRSFCQDFFLSLMYVVVCDRSAVWMILLWYPSYFVSVAARATRAVKRDLTILRIVNWSCSRSRVAALHYSDTCVRRKFAWSHCRVTSRWTSCSCPWTTDSKAKEGTVDNKFFRSDNRSFDHGVNFSFDAWNPFWNVLGGSCALAAGLW